MNLLLALLVFVVANGIFIARQRRRVQQLEEQQGPGRDRVPRAPQERFPAVDLFAQWSALPPRACERAFRTNTRLSRDQFLDLLAEVREDILANRHVRMHVAEPSGDVRATKLTVENRLLLGLKFLVCATSGEELAVEFGLSPAAVSEEIRHVIDALAANLSYEIAWPGPERRQQLSVLIGPQFVNAFGTADTTFTPTFRHAGDFSGHRHAPVRSHQLACDALGFVVDVVAGQIGARHDSFNYKRSTLPQLLRACGSSLLADSGYEGCGDELITPAAAERLAVPAEREFYRELHTSRRSRIEQFIGVIKALFRVVACRWPRHDREFLSVCVVVCCELYNRVKRLRA